MRRSRDVSFHNSELAALVSAGTFELSHLDRLRDALERHDSLRFAALPSGLFPASTGAESTVSGYGNVWVRDNVYIAHAHAVSGKTEVAARVARSLCDYFYKHRFRFESVIAGTVDPDDAMNRPHVRFDGIHLEEIQSEEWPHAQNDALGYFLWLYSGMARRGLVPLDAQAIETLALFPRYFRSIRFWQDEESGHWEEVRKISASSIGVVIAGLKELLALAQERPEPFRIASCGDVLVEAIRDLIKCGHEALATILPHECAQLTPSQNRRYDAALIFLIHPLGVMPRAVTDLILHDTDRFLTGEHGIRRYLGDSYWAPDYETIPVEDRTRDYSRDMTDRDALLRDIGSEAQWSLFDPVLSAYCGKRFLAGGDASDRLRQSHHFCRTLGHLTSDWRCPELYYLQNDVYVPNDHSPLLWTQANLMLAFEAMHASAIAAS